MASAIYVQKHRGDQLVPPENWSRFCFGVGIVNIIGTMGVNVYNILFCVYIWVSIRNTLKPSRLVFYHYHVASLLIIFFTALTFYLTDDLGVSINGTCTSKMNQVSPYVSLLSFMFYIFIACTTLRSFKSHVPNITLLRLHRKEFIIFFNFYLVVNSILTAAASVTVIIFEQICIHEGLLNPGGFSTLINLITIFEGMIVVYIRLRHPLIKSHLLKLFNTLIGRRN
jgi:1-phosphatidylinositol-4-phosphate 5-kinase